MSINIIDKSKCCGCRACEQICPVKAIRMEEDVEGFIYPKLEESCIECGLCEKICPILNTTNEIEKDFAQKVYAAYINNEDVLVNSSSGGIFSVLAEFVLKQEGVVFGAAYNENMEVEHIYIEQISELYKLRGSKYVQSNTRDSYKQVKAILKEGRHILYVGTPCQIAGLKKYLGKLPEKLITVDLVCHGTPSPKMFREYIKHLENKYGKKVKEFNFRYKGEYGWGLRYKLSFNGNLKNITQTNTAALSPYYYAFLNDMLHRPVCYSCPYATEKREGDITLADYWGVEEHHPEIFNAKGNSLVIINSPKGIQIFNQVKQHIQFTESNMTVAKKKNGNLSGPSVKHVHRDAVYRELGEKGFEYISKKYCRPRKYLKLKLSSMIPQKIKRCIKR